MTPTRDTEDNLLLFQVLGFVGLLLIALGEAALGYFPALFGAAPKLLLICFFVFSIYLPAAFPLVSIFLVGVIFDLIQGSPFGFTSALLIMVQVIVLNRRFTLQQSDSGMIWYEFTLTMLAVLTFTLITMVLYWGRIPAPQPLLFQYSLSILLFPLVNWLIQLVMGIATMLEETQ